MSHEYKPHHLYFIASEPRGSTGAGRVLGKSVQEIAQHRADSMGRAFNIFEYASGTDALETVQPHYTNAEIEVYLKDAHDADETELAGQAERALAGEFAARLAITKAMKGNGR